jgi:hypothetical protein
LNQTQMMIFAPKNRRVFNPYPDLQSVILTHRL